MIDKWRIVISLAHDCRQIEVDTEAQARQIYKMISDAMNYGNHYIDIDDSIINLTTVEMIRLESPIKPPAEPHEVHCEYIPIRKIDMPGSTCDQKCPDVPKYTPTYSSQWNNVSVTHELTHEEQEMFKDMLDAADKEGSIKEETIVRRKRR